MKAPAKKLICSILMAIAIHARTAHAHDPDLDYILNAVQETPCSQVQVMVAKNIAAIYWNRENLRYLYGDDLDPLRQATIRSGKRVVAVDREFTLPDVHQDGWDKVYEQLSKDIHEIFADDYLSHPPDGC